MKSIVINYRDVTQRKATEKQLEYQAYYDALTGLPNRLLFRDRVVNAVAQAKRHRRGIAVMYLDLDHFKLVNDGLGHSVGDGLLSEVAARLQGSIRASDTISRLGGDEFTILLNDTNSTDAVFAVARKVLQSLARPFRVGGLVEAGSLAQLALFARDDGELRNATEMMREAIRIDHGLGNVLDLAVDLGRLASVLAVAGEPGTAARLLSASEALSEKLGVSVPFWAGRRNEQTLASVRTQLDEASAAEALERGRVLTVDEAVKLALAAAD